jgi:predicted Zn-dependent protease
MWLLVTRQNKWPRNQLAQMLVQMAQLRYGRKDELEADALGVRIMSDAGYDPRALLGVMEILARTTNHQQRKDVIPNFVRCKKLQSSLCSCEAFLQSGILI